MDFFSILQSEFLKTKRSIVRRVAIASPLCLAALATIQGGYFSLNLFNWFYVVFLPATFAMIGAAAVNIDNGKHALRTIRSLPIKQNRIWLAKLINVLGYALFSCLLLSVAVILVPALLGMFGTAQIKQLSVVTVLSGIVVMFLSSAWQIPFSFILSKKLGLIFTVAINLIISFSGVLLALKSYWLFCPWAWVNRCMAVIIGVMPNGLPVESNLNVGTIDVVLSLILSLALTAVLGFLATWLFSNSEAR